MPRRSLVMLCHANAFFQTERIVSMPYKPVSIVKNTEIQEVMMPIVSSSGLPWKLQEILGNRLFYFRDKVELEVRVYIHTRIYKNTK